MPASGSNRFELGELAMNENPEPEPRPLSAKHFLLALAVVLGGVALGSIIVVKYSSNNPRHYARPSMLGHEPPPNDWTNNMVWVPGGSFWMGSDSGLPDEQPVHQVTVDGFWVDRTEVTNEQFEKFVRATGYLTVAERKPDPKDFPGAPPEKLVPGSIVFRPPPGEVPLDNPYIWWEYVAGANWRHPEGPASDIRGREKHPVVHICWFDAMAYAQWSDKRLPTEAEWEYASRGGRDREPYVWGKEQTPQGKWNANIWQGRFPNENSLADGFRGTAPVATFEPNGYGLYDMAGNVWEWCQDWYLPDYYANSPLQNPPGPTTSFDPNEPGVMKRLQRGGSYLCSDLYCMGYRPSARMKASPDTGLSHTGFRCVRNAPPPTWAQTAPTAMR